MKTLDMRLVIADDSSIMRERIKSQAGLFEEVTVVGEAENGKIALEMIMQLAPDLVFLDLQMPEMGGIEVLRKVKEAKLKTKVCILTNYSFPQYRTRCLAIGADFFLCKSEEFEKTSTVIADMLMVS
jgi:two-component system, NarL family, response regulator DesR